MIGVVALLYRPSFLPNVLANFERQNYSDKLLVIVENGPGIGATSDVSLPSGTIVLRTEADRSIARNAGFAKLREIGVDHWALFEDDDLYGPEYLAEHWEYRGRADVIGKGCFWLRGADGSCHRLFSGSEWKEVGLELGFVKGGLAAATLFGKTAGVLEWLPGMLRCEELIWYTDMLRAGRRLYSTSDAHFLRCRYDDASHAHATPNDWRWEVTGQHAVEVPPKELPEWVRALSLQCEISS